ncbi:ENPL-like protein [Mya arenaria]|uniref:ENPL-like protein n=1 Tax=Mya arenaria TaxID=6604 RepID=A0ABY7FUZ1_MYAAR|nr:ENPL-like protein [Mya arenaria]
MKKTLFILAVLGVLCVTAVRAEEDDATVELDMGKSRDGSRTDDEVVGREEEAIKLDGLNVAQMKELRDKAEKHAFQAEVNRMMKLIINSLYKNKEIFLRELISNASDALDKIRFLSLTDKSALSATDELSIKIKADKDNHVLHVIDTGVGMTKNDLVNNLGTIAKSGTSEFLTKLGDASSSVQMNDLIGQFGVGFYASFLVADRVIVTSKHNDDEQYVWESDSNEFSVSKDPRGNTLGRGTQISLHLKEEAHEFLEEGSLKSLVQKYSQFINFNIYLWESKTEEVEEPLDEDEAEEAEADKEEDEDDDEAEVEEEKEDDKPKTKKVSKTVWDWVLVNNFYKSIGKHSDEPLAKIHFTAEGEMYVRRVFITEDFEDMMPKYLSFVNGVVDSDDLPLNVSRETLQQHKLLKVIKKKLVRKTLDMIKKIEGEDYDKFWKEYSTNIKLGVIEDHSNRTRLAKLLKFFTSNSDTEQTSLADYIERMKEKQEHIYFMAGTSRGEVEKSPFVERLLKKGYEVLYLTEPVDEYCIQSLPEFEGKKFQNVAKEGVKIDQSEKAKEYKEGLEKDFEPLMKWLKEKRLTESPCALVASQYGWSGNMERIMKAQAYAKSQDPSQQYYATQKKTLEINPRHPLIKELKTRIEANEEDDTAKDLAYVMFETATLRSGFNVPDSAAFATRIEKMLRHAMDVDLNAKVEEEPVFEEEEEAADDDEDNEEVDADGEDADAEKM